MAKESEAKQYCLQLYFDGLPYEKISRQTGLSLDEVKSLVYQEKLFLDSLIKESLPPHLYKAIRLGRFLATARKKQNISQKQLGFLVNCSQGNISQYESGKIIPDALMLFSLSKVLNLDLNKLKTLLTHSTES